MKTTSRSRWFGPRRPFHPFGRGLFMLLSVLLLALPVPALAAPGDLDPSFDGDGRVLTDFRSGRFSGFDSVNASVVHPNGKSVVAGSTTVFVPFGLVRLAVRLFALARYNPDGSLDRSFGGDGRVSTRFGDKSFNSSEAHALVLQPDGKLVAAGFAESSGRADVGLARFNPDGSLDPSFGSGGHVRTDFGPVVSVAFALVLQPDGKLVAAGVNVLGLAAEDIALVRYNPDGNLDTSFGSGGLVRTDFGGSEFVSALVLQPDGKVVAAGVNFVGPAMDIALARYNPDGNLDTSFGSGGLVRTDFGGSESADALVLQPDGKLVAAGSGSLGRAAFVLARYSPNGSIDTSFGAGGVALTRFGGGSARVHALSLTPDGKLLAANPSNASGDEDFALARYVTTDEPLAVPRRCGGRRVTILGTPRKDAIRGTRGPDVILGLAGNDTIRGLRGNDTICGGPGLDTLIGNEGNDRLLGDGQNDRLFGDNGRDSLDGGTGRDACSTGETARRCEGQAAASERPRDPPKPPCPPVSNFPC